MTRRTLCSWGCLVVAALCGAGCESESATRPSDIRTRQDAALKDPFGYKLQWNESVSGGDMTELKKDELKRDLKNVLNP